MHGHFFSHKYSTCFLQQIGTASLQKVLLQILQINNTFQAFHAGGCLGLVLHTFHDWRKHNQSQLEKEKKASCFNSLPAKEISFVCFCFENGQSCRKSKSKEDFET